jgi:hypothetical protein
VDAGQGGEAGAAHPTVTAKLEVLRPPASVPRAESAIPSGVACQARPRWVGAAFACEHA